MKYGLALAGGGTRGAAHVGVLAALEEEGLLPGMIAGTSAGGIVAGLYGSGMTIKEMKETVEWLTKRGLCYMDPDVIGLLLFIPQIILKREITLTGLIKGNRLENLLCSLTEGKTIEQAVCGLVIPSVDIKSGTTVAYTNLPARGTMDRVRWETRGYLCEIMMASASVPGVFQPRHLQDYCLVDGGVTNNLPVDLLIAAGQPRVIAIDIGTDYKMPHDTNIIEIVSHSFSIMSGTLKDCMSSGEVLLLKPELKTEAGLLTFEYMKDCMEEGYEYTKKMMPEIRRTIKGFPK